MINEEQVLEKKEENMQAILNTTKDPLLLLNLDGIVITLNEIAAKKLSKSVDELIGSSIYDIIPPNDIKFSKAQINKITYSQNLVRVEKEMFGRSFEYSSYPNFDVQEKVEQITISANDIIEHKKVEKEFSLKIEQSQKLLDHSPAVVFSFTPQRDFTINLLSENIKRILGYEPKEFINHPQYWFDCVHPEDLPYLFSILPNLLEKGSIATEYRFKNKNGEFRWIYDEKRVVYDKNGQPSEIIGSWLDITERKKTEQKLKESEEKYSILFDNTPIGVGTATFDGTPIAMNKMMQKTIGYSFEELKSIGIHSLYVDSNEREFFMNILKKEDKVSDYKPKLKLKDGTEFIALLNADIIEINGEKLLHTTIQDITEQRSLESKLKESEENFRMLAEQSLFGIGILQDNIVKYVNHKMSDITGYSIQEMLHWNKEDLISTFHPDDKKLVMDQMRKKQNGSKDYLKNYQHQSIKKNGEIIWLEIYSNIINYDGKPADLVEILDITERMKFEQKLKESEKKYHDAYNRMIFYQNLIAHDISNILNNIKSSVYLLSHYQSSDEKRQKMNETIKMIKEQTIRGDNLVKNVRKLSRLKETQISLSRVEITNVLEEVIKSIHKSFENRKINIQVDSVCNELFAQANDLLFDVFENILHNAIKHNINPFVEIIIKIAKEDKEMKKYLKLEFIDNGIGIPDNKKQLIFQKSISKKKYTKGMGIGLSLVNEIIKNYNGYIWVENKFKEDYSKGSNFVILIPEVV